MSIPICVACGFLIMICSYILVRALEDYHRDKIETVITTVQSEGNLIKQDTVYRYK